MRRRINDEHKKSFAAKIDYFCGKDYQFRLTVNQFEFLKLYLERFLQLANRKILKMKKILVAGAIIISSFALAQRSPIRELYAYSGKNNAEMVKAKTDLFVLNIISSGIQIHNNSTADDHIDINMIMPFNKGKITSRVRYDFLKDMYVVSLSNTKVVDAAGKITLINNEEDANHKKILDNLKSLVFTAYQKEINN